MRAAWIASSSEMECTPSDDSARFALTTAFTEPTALRSMHGACTRPSTGSQVRPRLCSIAVSAACSITSGLPPMHAAKAPAAIEQLVPTSAMHPPSAALIVAPRLKSMPIAAAVKRKVRTRFSSSSGESATNSTT